MSEHPVSRNDPCPCGSGKKFKRCCGGAGVKPRNEPNAALPDPDDDLLFPDASPDQLQEAAVEAMREVGVDPALIYAFEKTGLIVGEDNQRLIPPEAMAEWKQAVEEYRQREADNYPLATAIRYGPDDKTATKLVAAVFAYDGAEPILERWVSSDIDSNAKVHAEFQAFIKKHGVRRVVAAPEIMGCPHEEGEDFPDGADCPFCPFWKGKQGTARQDDF
jgi:SEC-C motif